MVSVASGFTSFVLFTGLAVLSFVLFIHTKQDKYTMLFDNAATHLKNWWNDRPSLKE
jgi:hypothetical protein